MTIDQLKTMIEARITHLEAQKTQATQIGDIEQVTGLETAIAEAIKTLVSLKSLG